MIPHFALLSQSFTKSWVKRMGSTYKLTTLQRSGGLPADGCGPAIVHLHGASKATRVIFVTSSVGRRVLLCFHPGLASYSGSVGGVPTTTIFYVA